MTVRFALTICLVLATSIAALGRDRATKPTDEEGMFLDEERDEFAADADADVYAGPAPLTVAFTARTINAKGRVRYAWNFDDRTTSTEQNPRHTFRKPGWYIVTMDARDDSGESYRITLQLRAWKPRDWDRFHATRDPRIVARGVRELQRKRARDAQAAETAAPR
jgi:hypothetical protein